MRSTSSFSSSSSPHSLELDDFQFAGSGETSDTTAIDDYFAAVQEEQPLISQGPSSPTLPNFNTLDQQRKSLISRQRQYRITGRVTAIMEKVKDSKVARLVDKLAVTSEPGLTNAQLMLTNFDLKPGPS